MKIPFSGQVKKVAEKRRSRPPTPTSDEARIQRELDYHKRIGQRNPRLSKLHKRVSSQKRRSYGR